MKTNHRPTIEHLESRIAPAGLITIAPDKHSATWDDVDGDKVTLTVSKGILSDTLFTTDQTPATGLLVNALDLTDATFRGADVKLKAVRGALNGGNDSVNIGYVNSTGHGLGNVLISGDLGRIDAGFPSPTATTPKALVSLNVGSLGVLEGAMLPAGMTQTSELIGAVGEVKVRGSVQGILFNVTGGNVGSIAALTIGGSLIGTADADSGRFSTSGKIGAIKIGGDIAGGAGQNSGSIQAGGRIASLTVGGSIFGGRSEDPSTDGTGVVRTEQILGPVKIFGGLFGGTQQGSGVISSAGNMTTVDILGGITGGSAGTSSGAVIAGGNVVSIKVGGDITGGGASDSGAIRVAGKTGAITVGGALTGGVGDDSGSLHLGTFSSDTVGKISIARDLVGGAGDRTGSVVAAGNVATLSIGGAIRGAAGEDSGVLQLDSGAGRVVVRTDVVGSTGENSGSVTTARSITNLVVGGSLLGGTADHAGSIFAAGRFGSLVIAGSVIGGDLASDATGDLANSGSIEAQRVGRLAIGGSLRVGQDYNATFELVDNAAIRIQNDVGSLKIGGAIEGTEETTVVISAHGQVAQALNPTLNVAFGSIAIGGGVRHAAILAGYNTNPDISLGADNPDAQIGTVTVGGDWVASDLISGVAWNENFGNGTDRRAPGVNNPDLSARIASIIIGGQVIGTADDPTDRFGFVAQQIDFLQFGPAGSKILFNKGWRNDNDPTALRYNLAGTGDVRVFEFL